jgi:hypothetical protein
MSLFGYFWIEHHLNYAFSIPQVNKYKPSMVTASVYPASEGYFRTYMLFPELTTVMVFEHSNLLKQNSIALWLIIAYKETAIQLAPLYI